MICAASLSTPRILISSSIPYYLCIVFLRDCLFSFILYINLMSLKENVYTDPGLLRKHSEVISVTTDKYKYPGVRIFYREHPKASVLPPKLPLLVFIHGRFPRATVVS